MKSGIILYNSFCFYSYGSIIFGVFLLDHIVLYVKLFVVLSILVFLI